MFYAYAMSYARYWSLIVKQKLEIIDLVEKALPEKKKEEEPQGFVTGWCRCSKVSVVYSSKRAVHPN